MGKEPHCSFQCLKDLEGMLRSCNRMTPLAGAGTVDRLKTSKEHWHPHTPCADRLVCQGLEEEHRPPDPQRHEEPPQTSPTLELPIEAQESLRPEEKTDGPSFPIASAPSSARRGVLLFFANRALTGV